MDFKSNKALVENKIEEIEEYIKNPHTLIELERKMKELDGMYFTIVKLVYGNNQALSSYPQWIRDNSQMFRRF